MDFRGQRPNQFQNGRNHHISGSLGYGRRFSEYKSLIIRGIEIIETPYKTMVELKTPYYNKTLLYL